MRHHTSLLAALTVALHTFPAQVSGFLSPRQRMPLHPAAERNEGLQNRKENSPNRLGLASATTNMHLPQASSAVPVPGGGADHQHDTNVVYEPKHSGTPMEDYKALHARSVSDPQGFWGEQARQNLVWIKEFDRVLQGGFEHGDVAWFTGGLLNVCYNCLDRHLPQRANQVAILHEGDEPGQVRRMTYDELLRAVCRVANAMLAAGVRKGDVVTIYMPMVPETVVTMLACARIGAPHSVVFAGFSSEALRDRISDARSKWVFTSDKGRRGGRVMDLKRTVDQAVEGVDCVQTVFVFHEVGIEASMKEGRDVSLTDLLPNMRPYCPCEPMSAEDLLFMLYTSGSTGKPKGVAHTSAGYLLYTMLTSKHVFNLREGDVYACVADVGWITGHSYIVYGPLANGVTTVLFESTPLYPDHNRYWDLVEKHKVTQFYTAPTAIRALMRSPWDDKHDLSSLRILGSVGEPINPEAWYWYFKNVGRSECSLVDTWWQTETGGHMLTPLPGITPMKPGSCSLPFYGIDPVVLDPATGEEMEGNEVEGVLAIKTPWPGMARTITGDHKRYQDVYLRVYKGYYFTGDGCRRDKDGFYWITGRVDDVLNVSGHRIGTAEVEAALAAHHAVSEAAVVGFSDPIKGQAICCYVTFVEGHEESDELIKELRMQVRQKIGPFATPDIICGAPGLPKTRSGKIMRRILRKIAEGKPDELGDTSTLAEPAVVYNLVETMGRQLEKRAAIKGAAAR